jgi:hypothetical protein
LAESEGRLSQRVTQQTKGEAAMGQARRRRLAAFGSLGAVALLANPQAVLADAGGFGFWFPGAFGSLAAAPGVPGWAYATIYVHEQESAGAGKNFVVSGRAVGSIVAGLSARADVVAEAFSYTSAMPVLGGQAAFTVVAGPGNVNAGISATLTGPLGNTISGSASDNRTTLTDLIYQGTLKWNQVSTTRWSTFRATFRVAPMIRIVSPI